MKRAFIFPGQGSQIVGMAKDFYNSEKKAKEVFDTVDEVLGYKLTDIIFNGPAEELSRTVNTQPALMASSIAILEVMLDRAGKKIEDLCSFVAGHSLGEYTALCAAQTITVEDAAKLLKVRAISMQNAAPEGTGAMAACLSIPFKDLEYIIEDLSKKGVIQIANDNVEGQVVVSGENILIDQLVAAVKDCGFRAIKLNVSAPFHSELIKDAQQPMLDAINNTNFNTPKVPLIANITANIEVEVNKIKNNLVEQICGRVRWRETMEKMNQLEVTELIEIGSGRVLSGLAKKSPYNFSAKNISNLDELNEYLENNLQNS